MTTTQYLLFDAAVIFPLGAYMESEIENRNIFHFLNANSTLI